HTSSKRDWSSDVCSSDLDNRPKLYVFGESLGSYGSEAAFSSIHDVVNRTDGAVWVGPTSFNELHERLVDARDPGSPAWLPIVDRSEERRVGRAIRAWW